VFSAKIPGESRKSSGDAESTCATAGRCRQGLTTRRLVIYVETEPALGVDEEPYSCTVTIPDDAMAKVSA
jgi:hypothetical protein